MFKKLESDLAQEIIQKACKNSRLRESFYFHHQDEKVQRTILALQPGTYVRPHCHIRNNNNNGFEMLTILQGSVGVLLFNELGDIIHQDILDPEKKHYLIEIQAGIYHSVVVLLPDSLILEIKEGPYDPVTDKTFLDNFPQEGTPEAKQLITFWKTAYF